MDINNPRVIWVKEYLIKNEHQALAILLEQLRTLGYSEVEIKVGMRLYLDER